MNRVYILLGPPGCGKGTQTAKISKELNLPHIDTGSLLRKNVKEGTKFGLEAKKFMDEGKLVPIEVVANIIKDRLTVPDTKNGYILDGFPRNLVQAQALERIQKELGDEVQNIAIYFDIKTDVLVQRLVNRRFCPSCGAIFNLLSKKPEVEGKCDVCHADLAQRSDDNEETAKARFKTYDQETKPLLSYFKDKNILKTINAQASVDDVWAQVKEIVS